MFPSSMVPPQNTSYDVRGGATLPLTFALLIVGSTSHLLNQSINCCYITVWRLCAINNHTVKVHNSDLYFLGCLAASHSLSPSLSPSLPLSLPCPPGTRRHINIPLLGGVLLRRLCLGRECGHVATERDSSRERRDAVETGAHPSLGHVQPLAR